MEVTARTIFSITLRGKKYADDHVRWVTRDFQDCSRGLFGDIITRHTTDNHRITCSGYMIEVRNTVTAKIT